MLYNHLLYGDNYKGDFLFDVFVIMYRMFETLRPYKGFGITEIRIVMYLFVTVFGESLLLLIRISECLISLRKTYALCLY